MTHEPAPHADRDHSEQPVAGPLCARCGQPALGFATINGVRYCHSDERSCYTEQCHENPTHARMKARLDARKAARQAATPSMATAGSDPTQGTSRAEAAREVVAAGDADEVTRLRAELKRLGLEVAKVARERSAAEAERDRLAEVVARVEAYREEILQRADRAGERPDSWRITAERLLYDLGEALSGPSPAETPQNGPEPALSREQGTSGQSGEGEALRGAENGPWVARCDVPNCGWRSLPFRNRSVADHIATEHWEVTGHGCTIGADR